MIIVITGADGFIGKNLATALEGEQHITLLRICRTTRLADLRTSVAKADVVFHLAGVNRSDNMADFEAGNVDYSKVICDAIASSGRSIPVIFTSSIHAGSKTMYGETKAAAEVVFTQLASSGNPVVIYRLPNVFGKWSKPNYNSVVSTFCSNIVNSKKCTIIEPDKELQLVYVDDLIDSFIECVNCLNEIEPGARLKEVASGYSVTVAELHGILETLWHGRKNLQVDAVGSGLKRALYATLLSYVPKEACAHDIVSHSDPRGTFAEFLKTDDSGQVSVFSVYPFEKRGGHFHNTKTERFLILKGEICFRFVHVVSKDQFEVRVNGDRLQVVETIPGWAHELINVGSDVAIGVIWANEIFDKEAPDTIPFEIQELPS